MKSWFQGIILEMLNHQLKIMEELANLVAMGIMCADWEKRWGCHGDAKWINTQISYGWKRITYVKMRRVGRMPYKSLPIKFAYKLSNQFGRNAAKGRIDREHQGESRIRRAVRRNDCFSKDSNSLKTCQIFPCIHQCPFITVILTPASFYSVSISLVSNIFKQNSHWRINTFCFKLIQTTWINSVCFLNKKFT